MAERAGSFHFRILSHNRDKRVLIDVFLGFQPFLKYPRMKFYFIMFSYAYFEILLTKSFRLYEFSCNPPFLFVCLKSDCQDLSVLLHIILDDSFSLLPSILIFDCITICLSIYSDKHLVWVYFLNYY